MNWVLILVGHSALGCLLLKYGSRDSKSQKRALLLYLQNVKLEGSRDPEPCLPVCQIATGDGKSRWAFFDHLLKSCINPGDFAKVRRDVPIDPFTSDDQNDLFGGRQILLRFLKKS